MSDATTDDEHEAYVCDVCGRHFETKAEQVEHLRSEGLID